MMFSRGFELDNTIKHPFNGCYMYRQTARLCQIIKSDLSPKIWIDLLILFHSWSYLILPKLPVICLDIYFLYTTGDLEKELILIFFFFACLVCMRVCVSF